MYKHLKVIVKGVCPKCGNDGKGDHLLGYSDPKFVAQVDEMGRSQIKVGKYCTQCKASWNEYYSINCFEMDE